MIRRIESLLYEEVKKMENAEEREIKGHKCIFVDLDEDFGYSVLVFKDNRHIYFANDYELHHNHFVKEYGKEALKQWYIESLENKLYTDEELLERVASYDEYNKKNHFLLNYWIMRYEYVSCIAIEEEEKKALQKKKKHYPIFNPLSFCYVADISIVKEQNIYHTHLKKELTRLKSDDETFRKMVRRELQNHEACITGEYVEALSALGVKFSELSEEKKKIVKEELKKEIEKEYF